MMMPLDVVVEILLNLINNAFQASAERSRSGEKKYQPQVDVSTERKEEFIEIKVSDNGPGIPDEIRDKIFQPFFTTKPTGEGTGLGLSLSYDIITKSYDGTIEVDSKIGAGTSFTVRLPIVL